MKFSDFRETYFPALHACLGMYTYHCHGCDLWLPCIAIGGKFRNVKISKNTTENDFEKIILKRHDSIYIAIIATYSNSKKYLSKMLYHFQNFRK